MKKHLIWLLVGLLALVLGTYGLQYLDGKITMPLFANNNVQVETNAKALEVDNLNPSNSFLNKIHALV